MQTERFKKLNEHTKQDKLKEIYAKIPQSQTETHRILKKSLESNQGEKVITVNSKNLRGQKEVIDFSCAEKKKTCQPRILYPMKTFFRIKKKKIKTFSDKGKIRQCISCRLTLKQ